jgi:nucleoid-associated protein YgaU
MSTATLESTAAFPGGIVPTVAGTTGPRSRAGHLRLVPTGAAAATAVDATMAPAARQPRASALRITRRGRLALTSTATLVVAMVLLSLMGLVGPAGATSSVVVQPGMTLSQIAAEQLPGVPLSQAVTDIQRANKLSTSSIAVGQELVIPVR